MATLLYRLGRFAYDRRRLVLSLWLVTIIAVGGAAAAFHGTLSNDFKIPGTETQRMLDKLKEDLPSSSGGSATVVFEAPEKAFSAEQRASITKALDAVKDLENVEGVTNPFTTQAQLDEGAKAVTDGEKQLKEASDNLKAQNATLAAGQKALDAKKKEALAQGIAASEVAKSLAPEQQKIDDGKKKTAAAAAQIDEQTAELAQGERQAEASAGLRFVSTDGQAAIAQIQFSVSSYELTPAFREVVQETVSEVVDGVEVYPSKDLTEDVSELFGTAEAVGIAIAAVVLLLMLGTLIAAGLPLLMAVVGVGVGVGGTFALTKVVDMSSISPMLALMLGLAVGIDYSLFIVNRHRNQLLAGMEMRESVARATGTAGNAVLFAGLTVVIALAALVVPGLPFLTVMGLSAAATVAVAVLVALTLTPAVLGLIGQRLISKRRWAKATAHNADAGHESADAEADKAKSNKGWGAWVTRRPVIAVAASVLLLAIAALPAAQLRLALPDGGSEPADSSAFKAYEATGKYFGQGMTGPIVVVGDLPEGLEKTEATTKQFDVADELRAVEGVTAAIPLAISDDLRTAVFQVIPEDGPASASTVKVVEDLRAKGTQIKDDTGVTIGLTGQTAGNVDISAKLADALPPYLAIVIGLSFVLLLLVFRSILVPLLATAGFLLSLTASFGAVVAVYQWGWLGPVFDVTHPGAVLSFLPILLIGILFGLAMDYQVFITSGIREAYMHGEAPAQAVRSGFRHAAAVVTAAAIIMISVFAGFIFSHLTMIRPMGFALAFGVLLDAFVVRMTIVPAAMQLLGKHAWWLPRWLDRLLPDLDVEGAKLAALSDTGSVPSPSAAIASGSRHPSGDTAPRQQGKASPSTPGKTPSEGHPSKAGTTGPQKGQSSSITKGKQKKGGSMLHNGKKR